MRYYDYQKAKEIINREKNNKLKTAYLHMGGDSYSTEDEIWNEADNFIVDIEDKDLRIGGLRGSYWATPTLVLEYEDSTKNYPCHDGE